MKRIKLFSSLIFIIGICGSAYAQVEGNVDYSNVSRSNNDNNRSSIGKEIIPVTQFERENCIVIEVNALYNAPADHFVAVFNVSQLGETATSANDMFDSRLKGIKDGFIQAGIKEKDIFVDMLTFVPEYEYEVTKKVFSKTFNEIPKGFRIQKNIMVRFNNSKKLDQLVAICAKYEVYDLVKVDYYNENSKIYYDSLRIAAKTILKARLKDYIDLGINTEGANTQITENTFVVYPVEKYDSYKAYNSSSIDAVKKSTNVVNLSKSTTSYYSPVTEKGYDIVFNPVITEPVIQYALSMKMKLILKDPKQEPKTEYYMLAPNGTLVPIKK
jgi:uncharacterized protein YggE